MEKTIRVGIFDQIVSGGGVRFFTVKLLEEFSRQSGGRWHFHLMWPLFDSSDNFLPALRLPHTSFERIESGGGLSRRDKICLSLEGLGARRIRQRVSKVRTDEQERFRCGDGAGLRWLDQRIQNFDLIFVPYPYLTLPIDDSWRPSKPMVITLHDLAHELTDAWGGATARLREEVKAWTRLANLVIFSSEFVRQESERLYQLPSSRSRTILLSRTEQPQPDNKSRDVLRRYSLKEGYVFTLGWAAKHKRVETIIEGFALFKKRSHLDISLVIAGPRTDTLLHANLFGLELGKDIFALGFVREEDVPALYHYAALVVTASISEAGLNTMIFDAMTHERAVVCSDIPQFVERLGRDNQLALIFDRNSPQALADTLLYHFQDPDAARARIKEAKEFISQRNLADVAGEYLSAFESVL